MLIRITFQGGGPRDGETIERVVNQSWTGLRYSCDDEIDPSRRHCYAGLIRDGQARMSYLGVEKVHTSKP